LTHFEGTQDQWLALAQALTTVSVTDPKLDDIILKNAVWAHHFDDGTQRIFARGNKVDKDFIYYAVYEMIVNKARPIPEAIAAFESVCDGLLLLVYGLAHVYLHHDITTAKSDGIIQAALAAQEEERILFPVFKEIKAGSKYMRNTYIEKYRPFMYKTLPGKDVRLYYKVDGEDDWRVQDMDYWRFGLYLARVPHFYNESISYYFSEELPTGSIATKQDEVHNQDMYLDESQSDPFFIINNATIYEQMFRYEHVEEIINVLVKDVKAVRSRLM